MTPSPEIWIIPARAGFTQPGRNQPQEARDHPRSRGVYARLPLVVSGIRGSSPLARGLPVSLRCSAAPLGIIPARAGFTAASTTMTSSIWDHPRSRGVYTGDAAGQGRGMGSSPLARGLLAAMDVPVDRLGIIPARAGFTVIGVGCGWGCEDHPRSRGVYCSCVTVATRIWRIIPARAGFTTRPRRRGPAAPDHPRSRGVYW